MIAKIIRSNFTFKKALIIIPFILKSSGPVRRLFSSAIYFPKVARANRSLPTSATLLSGFLFGAKKAEEPVTPSITAKHSKMTEEIISKSEELYTEKNWDQLYTHLKEALTQEENQVGEVYWRMARVCREKANTTADKEHKKNFTTEGFDNSSKGVTKDPESFGCNKWHGIMLDLTARLEGTKKRIENSYLVKQHLTKAAEIDPKDATIQHTLGVWCFEVADLGWMQRKLAAAFFATPPTSSYEEALQHLEAAEKISPNFYCFNLVYLGKCHLRMGNKAQAKEALQKAIDLEKKNSDDDEAKKEAADLIKKC